MAWRAELSAYAEAFVLRNVTSERVLARIESAVEMLREYPEAGPAYSPDYPAARPPFPCRYLPLSDTPFTLFYLVDTERQAVTVFDIEWSAGDPRHRFAFVG